MMGGAGGGVVINLINFDLKNKKWGSLKDYYWHHVFEHNIIKIGIMPLNIMNLSLL
jgi:hypothetical protein